MTVILNLDDIVPQPGIIRWRGKEYKVFPFSVQQMMVIASLRHTLGDERLNAIMQGDLREDDIDALIQIVRSAIPDFPEEDLRSLPFDAFAKLLEFIHTYQATSERGEGNSEGDEGEAEGNAVSAPTTYN